MKKNSVALRYVVPAADCSVMRCRRYLGLQHLIQMKGMSDTDVTAEEIILRIASEDPSAISEF